MDIGNPSLTGSYCASRSWLARYSPWLQLAYHYMGANSGACQVVLAMSLDVRTTRYSSKHTQRPYNVVHAPSAPKHTSAPRWGSITHNRIIQLQRSIHEGSLSAALGGHSFTLIRGDAIF